MKIQSQLDSLRNEISGCQLTAFGDLASGLILRSSSDSTVPREKLDSLCCAAVENFKLFDSLPPDQEGSTELNQAVISFTASNATVFARHAIDPSDVTIASVNSGSNLEEVFVKTINCAEDFGTEAE